MNTCSASGPGSRRSLPDGRRVVQRAKGQQAGVWGGTSSLNRDGLAPHLPWCGSEILTLGLRAPASHPETDLEIPRGATRVSTHFSSSARMGASVGLDGTHFKPIDGWNKMVTAQAEKCPVLSDRLKHSRALGYSGGICSDVLCRGPDGGDRRRDCRVRCLASGCHGTPNRPRETIPQDARPALSLRRLPG